MLVKISLWARVRFSDAAASESPAAINPVIASLIRRVTSSACRRTEQFRPTAGN